jgi:hypothetical protein
MSQEPRDTAVQLFDHYITLVMTRSGCKVDSDTHVELAACIDAIIEAARAANLDAAGVDYGPGRDDTGPDPADVAQIHVDATICDECGAAIPDSEPSTFNRHHAPSCSCAMTFAEHQADDPHCTCNDCIAALIAQAGADVEPSAEYQARLGGKPQWEYEHGDAFAVPSVITSDPQLVDVSWHNDVSPAFCLKGTAADPPARLWVDHPVPSLREFADAGADEGRYLVTGVDGTFEEAFYRGDDVEEAIRILKAESVKAVIAAVHEGRIAKEGDTDD